MKCVLTYQQGPTLALANTMKPNWWENTRIAGTFSHFTSLELIFSELVIAQHALRLCATSPVGGGTALI